MTSSRRDGSEKVVIDSIHGDVHLTEREVKVIDTASFQRLRNLKQLAMSQMAYPNATHTRFAHSIGVLAIMGRITKIAKESGQIKLSNKQEENLRLAALLHDIGHYPYSHLMERIDNVKLIEEQAVGSKEVGKALDRSGIPYPEHDLVGTYIVTGKSDLVEALGGKSRAKAIANLFGPKRPTESAISLQLSMLVHSSLDMDRLDYLLRDSQATGVPYGQIDINYLLNSLKVSPSGRLGISEKALPALRRLRDQGKYEIPKDGNKIKELVTSEALGTFTDAYVDQVIQKAVNDNDQVIQTLAKSIQKRRPPKLLAEVNVLVSNEERGRPHKGTIFTLNCRHKLHKLADDFNIPLEQFILCETPPLRLEKRGRMVAVEEVIRTNLNEEEELIKVFVKGEEEPKSLVDIPFSFISRCAGLFFQSFRLYVVYEGENKDSIITQLRETITDWDKG